MRRNPGVYARLLEDNAEKSTGSTQQIERDLQRTFVGNSLLNTPQMIGKLRRVLTAYSFLDKSTGYCQSLNFIVALFLFLMEEEEAFWLLVVLIQDYLPSYYDEDLLGSKTDTHIFETFVQSDFPQIGQLFHRLGIPISLKVSPWFLCLYVSVLPTETTFRVLDWLFAEGSQVLFSVGLALIELNADLLLCADSFDTAYALWANITDRAFVGDQIFQLAYNKYHFRREEMDALRSDLRDEFRSRDRRELLRRTNLDETVFNQIMQEFNVSSSAALEMPQFQQVFARLFPEASNVAHQHITRELFNALDTNQDGVISVRELLLGVSTLTRGDLNVKAKLWFKVFDKNEDGLLDFAGARAVRGRDSRKMTHEFRRA
jgi:Ca2+-binding EF-hand superfamily protein